MTWISEVQVTDVTGSSQVSLVYNTATGRRGPFLIWDNTAGAALSSVKFTNLLETLDGLDSGAFAYYGTGGNGGVHNAGRQPPGAGGGAGR